MRLYIFDESRIFTGIFDVIDLMAPVHPGTEVAPPELTGSEVAQWSGLEWVILSERPTAAVHGSPDMQVFIVTATQKRLDDFAKTRNYDGILSAASYATDPSPRFASDGQCAVNARSATWAALYQVLAEVEAGTRPMPASFADVEPALPALEWTL